MKAPLRYLPLTGIILLLLIIGFYLIASDKEDIAEVILDEIIPEEGLSSRNVEVSQTDPDKGAVWHLKADEFKYSKDGHRVQFLKFAMKIEPEEDLHIELEGNKGEFNKETNEVNLYGELKGLTDTGYEIYTEHIIFKQNEDCLKTDEKVTFIGPYFTITGKGLYVDLKNETLEVLSDVNSEIKKESLNL